MSWQTKVRLYDSVPFSINQEHTRFFDSKAQQVNYFNTLPSTTLSTDGRYVKIHAGTIDVQRFKDTTDAYNYIVIENNTSETTARTYYCFVKEIEFVSSNVSRIHFEIDVLQTFMFDMSFKKSFIERQHNKQYNTNGTPVINVAPENINLGSEYNVISTTRPSRSVDTYFNTMLVSTTQALGGSGGGKDVSGSVVSGVVTPLTYYIILVPKDIGGTPFIPTVTYTDGVEGPKTLYNSQGASTMGEYLDIFKTFNSEVDANKIVGISYLPFYPFQAEAVKTGGTIAITSTYGVKRPVLPFTIGNSNALIVRDHNGLTLKSLINKNVFSQVKTYLNSNGLNESKLMMYPFTRVMLYDGLGGVFEVKSQYLTDGTVKVDALTTISSSPKSAYVVDGYLNETPLNNAVISNMNADVEIVNDHTATYIQGRKNSDRVAMNQGLVGGLSQFGAGVAIGAISLASPIPNPIGIASGSTMAVGGITNAFYSSATITAKHEDVKNLPPSLQTQAGASNLVIGYDMAKPTLQIKMLGKENLEIINNHFHAYGTTLHKMVVPNMKTRTHFNFVKTAGANITGKIPTRYLAVLKNIFDNGVTLWHTNDMYNYDVPNSER